MTLLKMANYMTAAKAHISKYSHPGLITGNHKTIGVCCIVRFWEGCDRKVTDCYRFITEERSYQIFLKLKPAGMMSGIGDINRKLILFSQYFHSTNMISMFMRNNYRFQFLHA